MRRYFDNSATSYPKPPTVAAAVQDYFQNIHASAGRGAYREAQASRAVLDNCRSAVARLLHANTGDHVIFTLNGTDALNLAIKGVVQPGNHVVTTAMDHNSVLRPLSALEHHAGVSWTPVHVDPETTLLDPHAVAAAIRPNTRLVAINHASNVTGVLQPIADIAAMCRSRGILLLVDAAQSAGHVPIDFAALGIDLLACPGHKGLLGPLGTGILLIRAGVEEHMRTMREGGTGSVSEQPAQPPELPDRFEAGSHNAVGLAGLLAGLNWILDREVAHLREHEQQLCERMLAGFSQIPDLKLFGPREVAQRVGVFSIRLNGLEPTELSAILETRYDILSRSGLHCAPLAHQTIGTLQDGGTTRLSMGPFTNTEDVDAVISALHEMAAGSPTTRTADSLHR